MTIPALIIFGDSIVDQGNNNNLNTFARCNYSPYGKDFRGGIPTGRFCNGKTPADLVAEELGIKEYLPAYLDPNFKDEDALTGASFASGGTGFDPLTSQLSSAFSMSDQLDMFKGYTGKLKAMVGEDRTNQILTNSLFLVVAGSNDLTNTYFTAGIRKLNYDIKAYTDFLVNSASDFIRNLYAAGGRRIGVFGIPPIGCLPSQRTLAGGGLRVCAENYNQAAQLFNAKLSEALHSLTSTLNDRNARLVYIDIYNPLIDIIQHPKKYGFEVVDKGCCGTGTIEVAILCNFTSKMCPDESIYLFWDSFHPTEGGYKVLVKQILHKNVQKFI
ncbi:GDSL esterase/lipase EXL3-like isoform X1 [Diospyros lotus]|nr:GDSL esterase/lipase EXL3-like isoform X1 [Diospyros lotus]